MWGPGKGFTSAFIDTLCIWDDEDADWVLLSLLASKTISSMSLLAWSNLSGVPSTNTFLNPFPGTSFLATCILAPLWICKFLIVSPPFPIMSPTQSLGTGII